MKARTGLHGRMRAIKIRQSDLASYGRCAQEKKLNDLSSQGLVKRRSNLSRTVYGVVVHHCLQMMETEHHAGNPAALEIARSTFAYYWNPDNLPEMAVHHPELAYGIDEWLPRDTYGGMRMAGLRVLGDYYELLKADTGKLLALELEFTVPVDLGPVGQHELTGTVDRLAVRKFKNKPYVSAEDFKTARRKPYLRYNVQFSTYLFASTQPEFWSAWGDEADSMYQQTKDMARRGRWIDMKSCELIDAGWRSEADYARLKVALSEYVKAVEKDVYPLTISGETCVFCPHRDGTCGGVPVPQEDDGRPA